MDTDLVAVELNIDTALVLQALTGIDEFPAVLVVTPNVYNLDDAERVRQAAIQRLTDAGILGDDAEVHPRVSRWLHTLYRPDIEMNARIVDFDPDTGTPRAMLRMALVRKDELHVLAIRADDHLIIQEVFTGGRPISTIAAAITSALGTNPPARVDSVRVASAELTTLGNVSGGEFARGLAELGAALPAARALARATSTVLRKAEILLIEHHDGGSAQTPAGVGVFDTPTGRVVASPSVGLDGEHWTTFLPGTDPTLEAGLRALVDLLPAGNWTDTARETPLQKTDTG